MVGPFVHLPLAIMVSMCAGWEDAFGLGFLGSILAGGACLLLLPVSRASRVVLVSLYIPGMGILLYIYGLGIACVVFRLGL